MYMLDTNIVSNALRFPHGEPARQIASQGPDDIAISIIVSAELRYGLVKNRSHRMVERVEEFLHSVTTLSFATPADETYAVLRDELARQGNQIGPNDMLIAAHALSLNAILVTANEREFSRVSGLKTDNWLRSEG